MARSKITPFKLYDCLIRLDGSRNNEVRKTAITAPEIMLLGAIHGSDAIDDIKAAGVRKHANADENARINSDRYERGRMSAIYESAGPNKQGFVARVFGPASIPLAREMDSERMPDETVPVQIIPSDMQDVVESHAALMG